MLSIHWNAFDWLPLTNKLIYAAIYYLMYRSLRWKYHIIRSKLFLSCGMQSIICVCVCVHCCCRYSLSLIAATIELKIIFTASITFFCVLQIGNETMSTIKSIRNDRLLACFVLVNSAKWNFLNLFLRYFYVHIFRYRYNISCVRAWLWT